MAKQLPRFNIHSGIREVLQSMGLDPDNLPVSESIQVAKIDPAIFKKLETEGLEVSLEDVTVCPDGTFEIWGQKIVLYISYVKSYWGKTPTLPKYHLSNCRTLVEMRQKNRFDRYHISRNPDGNFKVHLDGREQFSSLEVCWHCLENLNFKNFKSASQARKKSQRASFKIAEFLAEYDSQHPQLPAHTVETAPPNEYSLDWDIIRKKKKEAVSWVCEKCKIDLTAYRSFLHVHHQNGLKYDNSPSNLEALCVECHASEPMHGHMKNREDLAVFLILKRILRSDNKR